MNSDLPDALESLRTPDPIPRPAGPTVWFDRGPALPAGYGIDRLVALVRDPRTVLFYWMLDGAGWREAAAQAGGALAPVLRVIDLDSGTTRDVPILLGARSTYLEIAAGTRFLGEIGYYDAAGAWRAVLRSEPAESPPALPSATTDPAWSVAPEEFANMLALLGPSRSPYPPGEARTP